MTPEKLEKILNFVKAWMLLMDTKYMRFDHERAEQWYVYKVEGKDRNKNLWFVMDYWGLDFSSARYPKSLEFRLDETGEIRMKEIKVL